MAISRFKFVSPGIYLNEIDKSKLPTEPTLIGPTVIGRSVKGPMMRPVKVSSYADFVELFGEPNPGVNSGDIWRAGITLAPTYGAYAAKAYLASNGPLTFVRLGGYTNLYLESSDPESARSGWSIKNVPDPATVVKPTQNAGVYGLFVTTVTESSTANIFGNNNATASLAAVFYMNKGTIGIRGRGLTGSSGTEYSFINGYGSSRAGTWVRAFTSSENLCEFRLRLTLDDTGRAEDKYVDFTPSSKRFIRSQFNTNPTLVNDSLTDNPHSYFLGETFENSIPALPQNSQYVGVILGLEGYDSTNTKRYAGNMLRNAAASKTPWIISQHLGSRENFKVDANGNFPVTKLFRLHSLSEGEWNQNNLKISISDIKPSINKYEKFGSFTVSVRKISDNDQNPQFLEVYSNLNLNPASENYISKRIGDVYSEWSYSKKAFEEKGTYPNNSKYIRVEVSPSVEGVENQTYLPFGFYGVPKYKSVAVSCSAEASSLYLSSSFFTNKIWNSPITNQYTISGNSDLTCSIEFPSLPYVKTSKNDSNAISLEKCYFGIKTNIEKGQIFSDSITDLLKIKPSGVDEENSSLLTNSTLFSLDDVMFSSSTNTANEISSVVSRSYAEWAPDNRVKGYSITSKDNFFNANNTLGGYGGANFQKVARFTLPLYGGFDGFNILEKEPFSERTGGPLDPEASNSPNTSYAYNSLQVALDAVSDPDVVETNIITVPGIQNRFITDNLIKVCEQRGDALGIIDIENDFKSSFESKSEVRPNVEEAVRKLKNRDLNNSYGCCFFPAVLARDTSANALVSLPSSVVALGVLGSSAANSEIWFAPAGFTRGGLSNGAAGFPVVSVKERLTAKNRDDLYEVNINPIAQFPSEGIVIFGQKTLQATPTALDRINVRRLMIYLKKEISRMAATVLFDPNTTVTWERFTGQVVPFLSDVKSRLGLTDFKVVLDSTTTTPELVDRNILYAKIFLKPARAIEFIALDFILTNTGASFDD